MPRSLRSRMSSPIQSCISRCNPERKSHIWLMAEDTKSSSFQYLKSPTPSLTHEGLENCSSQPQVFCHTLTCLSNQVCPATPDGSELFILKATCIYSLGQKKECSQGSQLSMFVPAPDIQFSCIWNRGEQEVRNTTQKGGGQLWKRNG